MEPDLIRIKVGRDFAAYSVLRDSKPQGNDPMLRLTVLLYPIIASATAGGAVVAALVAGMDTWQSLALAALAGAVVGAPISFGVAKGIK